MAPPYSQSRELHLKLVLYGPAAAGKTSALNYLYRALRPDVRGQLVSVNTGNDRTLFFDFYPPPPARLLGISLHVQIYTASGGIQNDATRRSLLAGSDGILFIADSQRGREQDNIQALEQMRNCLFDLNLSLEQVPLVLAWNKRDLPDALSVGELEAGLNINQAPSFATVAQLGQGIFDSFRALTSRALDAVLKRRPDVLHGGQRLDLGQSSDVVTSRRILAMQDTQRALALLQGRYVLDSTTSDGHVPYQDGGEAHGVLSGAPVSTFSPGQQVGPAAGPSVSLLDSPHGVAISGVAMRSEGSRREDSRAPRRVASSGQRVVLEPSETARPATPKGQRLSNPPSALLNREKDLPREPGRNLDGGPDKSPESSGLDKNLERRKEPSRPSGSPWESTPPSPSRDLWFSYLLAPGSLRTQLQDVERQVWSGQWSAGVRRAASIFYALTAAEATREPDEGPAWRGLVLGLPVERYLRFRQAVLDAEAGKSSLEDGLFALFFLLDAALRKEAWLTRGA